MIGMRRTVWASLLVVSAVLASASPVAGDLSGRNPNEIRKQLESSKHNLGLALASLGDTRRALGLTWAAYVDLRAAHARVANRIGDTRTVGGGQPMYKISEPKIQEARERVLKARSILRSPAWTKNPRRLEVVAQHIRDAMQRIDLVINTSF